MKNMLILVLFTLTMTLSEAASCSSKYDLKPTCPVSYGVTIELHGNVRSPTNCAMKCNKNTDCQSAIFDAPGKTCTLNNDTIVNLNQSGCIYFLDYLELKYSDGSLCVRNINEPNLQVNCSVDTDCTFPLSNATCFNGTCTCVPQLSFDPATGHCVNECLSLGNTFKHYPGHIPDGGWTPTSYEGVATNITACEQQCIEDPTCRYAVAIDGCHIDSILDVPLVPDVLGSTSVRTC